MGSRSLWRAWRRRWSSPLMNSSGFWAPRFPSLCWRASPMRQCRWSCDLLSLYHSKKMEPHDMFFYSVVNGQTGWLLIRKLADPSSLFEPSENILSVLYFTPVLGPKPGFQAGPIWKNSRDNFWHLLQLGHNLCPNYSYKNWQKSEKIISFDHLV